MKVLRLHQAGELRLHEEELAVPGPGEGRLRVTAVGICGSDLHWIEDGRIGDDFLSRALVLGHEFAGVVEGGELDGRRVAADPAINCQHCEFCFAGSPNLCLNIRFAGHGLVDGALREAMNWPVRVMHPLPDSLSAAEGVMLEPLGVALHALDLAKLAPGMTIGIYGCGPIGLMLLQLALRSGARQVIATDRLHHRVEAARSIGAQLALSAEACREVTDIMSATGGRGVDVAFEVAGEDDAVATAVRTTRRGGRVILVGIPTADQTLIPASEARRRGLTLKWSRRMKHTYPTAIDLVEKGYVDVASLVTHRFPFDDFQKAVKAAQNREGLKVVIEPTQDR